MGDTYVPLSAELVHSTIWRESAATRVVWITMLCLADAAGQVGASVPGLADAARVSVAEAREALARLSAPDPDSRTTAHDGRRIEAIEGGWQILNWDIYQDRVRLSRRRQRVREAVRRYRERQKQTKTVAPDVITGNRGNPSVSPYIRISRSISNTPGTVVPGVIGETRATTRAEGEVLEVLPNDTELAVEGRHEHSSPGEVMELVAKLPSTASEVVRQLARAERRPALWARAMLGMLEGMGTPAGRAVSPDELAGALIELAATSASPTPACVRAFLARQKREHDHSRSEDIPPDPLNAFRK